jgi:hypothetical protein
LPEVEDGKTLSKAQIEQWIRDVAKTVFSTAFNHYSKDEMTF